MNQVFALDELAEHLGGEKRLAKYRIRYHLSQNRLKRLANGVYATVPAGADAETFEPDVFLAAAAIRPDAVFVYHSAFDLLGQGHSAWWTCTVCTDRPRAPVALGRNTIKSLTRPPAVRKQDESVLEEFKANRPSSRVYLVPGQRGGVMAREWNLVVPEHLQRPQGCGDSGS
ncbi:MAG: hypothetical protein GF400_11110 [Candidatus Eisenbacteria bacterium]|nr:hypothetical protein [Candidatus Eisenbacteria bacterium]